jgi:hypothetical protein
MHSLLKFGQQAWRVVVVVTVLPAFLFMLSNVPTAYAQAVASGSAVDVLGALAGQDVAGSTFTATATTGTPFAVNSTLACAYDLGPGATNCFGTNASGHTLVGPAAGVSTDQRLQVGAGFRVDASGSLLITNGVLDPYFGTVIRNSIGPVKVDDELRLSAKAVGTCDASREWEEVNDNASGGTTGARGRRCLCTSDGAGTPAYAWLNLATGTVGTSTACNP